MVDPVPCVVVGVGALGRVHARVLSKMPTARLVGVFDTDEGRAQEVARSVGVPVLPDLAVIPSVARAAVVAVPTAFHHAIAGPLIDAGVGCLVEKPLATEVRQAVDLVTRARQRGTVLMVGHVERFNPAMLALLAEGLEPRFLEAQRVSPFPFRSSDVGVVLDLMIHDIDLILHLVNSPVRTVHAVGIPVIGAREDMANARMVFENGAVANVTASRVALKTERKLRLFAQDTYVTLDFHKKTGRLVRLAPGVREGIAQGTIQLEGLTPLQATVKRLVRSQSLKIRSKEEPLALEDREFLSAVREQRDPVVTGEHGVRAMEVAAQVMAAIDASGGR